MGKESFDKFLDNHEVVHREDPRLARFKEFIDTEWGLPGVTTLFRGLFSGGWPPIPVPTQWDIPQEIDVVNLTWQQIQNEAFIDEMYPSVKMLMADNIANTQWAAQVMTVLAFYRIIQILPNILKDYEEYIADENSAYKT